MTKQVLRAATRGSALALWQTNFIAEKLGVEVETVIVQTEGDKTQALNTPIEAIRGTGVFVREVQNAVLDGRADFAVHSAKDLPSTTDEGLFLACVAERGDPRDVLVGKALEDIPAGGVIATGSVRRRAQLAAMRPDLVFANLRGNIDTRLAKGKDFDAIVMANAALVRLGREVGAHVFEPSVLVPQVAQGALAVECREGDHETIDLLAKAEHYDSRRAVDAERAFLARLGGGCDVPVGAYATVAGDAISMLALIASMDGHVVLRRSADGSDPATLGEELGTLLLEKDGGHSLLADRAGSRS